MFSVFIIFSDLGDILIKEDYKKDVTQENLGFFLSTILKDKHQISAPNVEHNGMQGYYIRRNKIVYLLISKNKISDFIALQFLESFYTSLRNFCGNLTEDAIRKNLLLVHELMCECLENGCIQTTNTEQLRSVVYTDPVPIKSDVRKPGLFGMELETLPGSAASGPLVRSRSNQAFKHDEVFVDVIEKLTVHFGKEDTVTRFHLNGFIMLKSLILQTHSLYVSFKDLHLKKEKDEAYSSAVQLDEYHFADCVKSTQFENRCSFIICPPQGEVSAMKYKIDSSIPSTLPFRLSSSLRQSTSSQDCDLTLRLSCDIPADTRALNIIVHIPVSSATRNVMQQFSMADCSATFIANDRKILWKIKSLPGNSEAIAKFKLVDAIQCDANRLQMGPVALEFEVSNFVCSGLMIRNVRAEDSGGKPIQMHKWVRYVTSADSYMFKI